MTPRISAERIQARVPSPVKRDLDAYLIKSGKSMSQVMREALVDYLQRADASALKEHDDQLFSELRKCTNRICSLLAKLGIDVSVMSSFMYRGLNEHAQEIYKDSYTTAVKRLKSRLTPDEMQIRDETMN